MKEHTIIPKICKETRRIKMFFELAKDLQDNEVVCEHCLGTGLEIADNVYGIKGDTAHIGVHFPYKHQSLSFCKHCFNGVQRKCPGCGSLRGRHNGDCSCGYDSKRRREKWRQEDIARWEKATKVSLEEAWGKYSALYVDNFNRYVFDADDLESMIDDFEEDVSALRIYGTSENTINLNAEDIISSACEDLHEEAGSYCDKDVLQKLLDDWCEKQIGTATYYPDFSVGVIFDVARLREGSEEENGYR